MYRGEGGTVSRRIITATIGRASIANYDVCVRAIIRLNADLLVAIAIIVFDAITVTARFNAIKSIGGSIVVNHYTKAAAINSVFVVS